jgi:hypothetical protein
VLLRRGSAVVAAGLADVRDLYRRAKRSKRLVVVQTADHGVDVLSDPPASRAVDARLERALGRSGLRTGGCRG